MYIFKRCVIIRYEKYTYDVPNVVFHVFSTLSASTSLSSPGVSSKPSCVASGSFSCSRRSPGEGRPEAGPHHQGPRLSIKIPGQLAS